MPFSVCGRILIKVTPLVTGSFRMAIEGTSTGRDRIPDWLRRASDIRLLGYGTEKDDTVMLLGLPALGDAAADLSNLTPAPRKVRVVGVLDLIRKSTRTFGLRLDDGNEVRGVVASPAEVSKFADSLLDRRVYNAHRIELSG